MPFCKRITYSRMHARLEFFDPPDIHDHRSMNAEKDIGIQRFFQCIHRHVEQMARPPAVQLDIILGSLHPIDVLYFDEDGLAGGSYSQALQIAARRGDGFKQEMICRLVSSAGRA